jgi:hypothetical protein
MTLYELQRRRRDSAFGIVTRLRSERPGFDSRQGQGYFSLRHRIQTGSGAHPVSYPVGTRNYFRGVKLPGREADNWFPFSTEVKNAWSYTSTSSYVIMAWCLAEHRDNFTFTFINSKDKLQWDEERWTGRTLPCNISKYPVQLCTA